MPFLKKVFDQGRLLLASMQMAPHGRHQFAAVGRSTLTERIGLDVLIEQFVRIQLRAVPGHENQPQSVVVIRDKTLRGRGTMHGVAVEDRKSTRLNSSHSSISY